MKCENQEAIQFPTIKYHHTIDNHFSTHIDNRRALVS